VRGGGGNLIDLGPGSAKSHRAQEKAGSTPEAPPNLGSEIRGPGTVYASASQVISTEAERPVWSLRLQARHCAWEMPCLGAIPLPFALSWLWAP
jgi:hypothetical protein